MNHLIALSSQGQVKVVRSGDLEDGLTPPGYRLIGIVIDEEVLDISQEVDGRFQTRKEKAWVSRYVLERDPADTLHELAQEKENLEQSLTSAEWSLSSARCEVGKLKEELASVRSDRDHMRQMLDQQNLNMQKHDNMIRHLNALRAEVGAARYKELCGE